jgi:autotransporter-associated beta strand protein
MRSKFVKHPVCIGGVVSILASAATAAIPSYNIYPFPSESAGTPALGVGISSNGMYAGGVSWNGGSTSNGVLYNIPSGTSTLEAQTGVIYGRSTVETTGVPYSVNNNGIMFGSSGAGSIVETGAPTVWQNGQAYNLSLPFETGAGQVYGSNNLNQAVGSVGGASGGLDQAALFQYNSTNHTSYAGVLTEQTTNGGTLQSAFAINDNDVIVGTANDPNNAALTVPFLLNLGAGAGAATIIPNSSSQFNAGIPFAISNTGLVTGSEEYNSAGGAPFIYNMASGVTTSIPLPPGTSGAEGRGINDNGEVVGYGGGQYAVPFLYDGTNSYDLQTLLANNSAGSWQLDDNTSSGAYGIDDNGDIVGRGMYNGNVTAFIMIPNSTTKASPQALTFNNTGGTGDGVTWDTLQQNWNNGTGPTTFSSANGDYVSFNDANNGHYNVSIPATVTPGSTTFNNSAGNYVVSGAGGIGGSGIFYKFGTGTLTLNTVNTYTGPTNIAGGTVILGVNGALPAGTILQIYGTGTSVIARSLGTAYALQLGELGISDGDTLDLTNNDLIVQTATLSSISSLVGLGYNGGAWNGTTGIISSAAGAKHPLMALGTILNDNGQGTSTPLYGAGGTLGSTFGGAVPLDGDILVKYTYYGDANLDGKVDGSDYSLIDNALAANQAYLTSNPTGTTLPYTGWFNGDFNYDGVIDGSDYTLIDNAFNSQGAVISAAVAGETAQIAGQSTAVPEPTAGLLGMASLAFLRRRRRSGPLPSSN